MRVLVLGSGAKDSAIAWWLSRSSYVSGIFVARGNYCTPDIAEKLPEVDPSDGPAVLKAVRDNDIDLVFVGTEGPLLTGVIEYLNENGVKTFGAPSYAIKLEDDKAFSRDFTDRHNIPTPKRSLFADIEPMRRYLERHKGKEFIVKSNNISPSRETLHSSDTEALVRYAEHLLKKGPVFLEEFMPGASITETILLDNKGYLVLPTSAEYTKRKEHDETPTGGMGAIAPVPMHEDVKQKILEKIIEPTLYGMKVERLAYRGVLTFSIIVKDDGEPMLVDYHVRFNDPATQAIVPLIKNDLIEILMAIGEDRVKDIELEQTGEFSVAVVLASEGYPLSPVTGREIKGLSLFKRMTLEGHPILFCGAVDADGDGRPITRGGRCVTIVGRGDSVKNANRAAYNAIDSIKLDGGWMRDDIGNKFFED